MKTISTAECLKAETMAMFETLMDIADDYDRLCRTFNRITGERWNNHPFVDDGGNCHPVTSYGGIDFSGLSTWGEYFSETIDRLAEEGNA